MKKYKFRLSANQEWLNINPNKVKVARKGIGNTPIERAPMTLDGISIKVLLEEAGYEVKEVKDAVSSN